MVYIFGIMVIFGNVMFVFIYLVIDILNDIYGCKVVKRVVWFGFFFILVMIIVM